MTVRVRFAPSPTGALHIGGARTALFNWLYARQTRGVFILRIEDTDEVRSTDESVGGILDGLRWLGLDWDEGPVNLTDSCGAAGPYFQMQRQTLYREAAARLIADGHAYHCICLPAELEVRRQAAMAAGKPPRYDGRCRTLSEEARKRHLEAGGTSIVRFRMTAEGDTAFTDLVRGPITFANAELDDFVLVKSSGIPTYNFAVVVDDHAMQITHVIRGDDHLSNTPRQLHLSRTFGWAPPAFAHLSMIHGPDGTRLSKRHGAMAVVDYRDAGFLHEALRNYLALLGWGTEDSQQIFSGDQLVTRFSLERCTRHPAVFDLRKLTWMDGQYLRKFALPDLADRALPFLAKAGLVEAEVTGEARARVQRIVALEQEKYETLADVPRLVEFFFREEVRFDEPSVTKVVTGPEVVERLTALRDTLARVEDWSSPALEAAIRGFCAEHAVKTPQVFHPLRVAVSGRAQGPSLFDMLTVLGKDRVLARLDAAVVRWLQIPTS